MKRWLVAVVAVCACVAGGCSKPGETGPRREGTGEAEPGQGGLLPADKMARMDVVKAAAFNFVGGGHDGRNWPAGVEALLPADFEGTRVNPAGYRLAPARDLGSDASAVPVIYEVTAPQEGGFVGYADGSVRWTTAEDLKSNLGKKGD